MRVLHQNLGDSKYRQVKACRGVLHGMHLPTSVCPHARTALCWIVTHFHDQHADTTVEPQIVVQFMEMFCTAVHMSAWCVVCCMQALPTPLTVRGCRVAGRQDWWVLRAAGITHHVAMACAMYGILVVIHQTLTCVVWERVADASLPYRTSVPVQQLQRRRGSPQPHANASGCTCCIFFVACARP